MKFKSNPYGFALVALLVAFSVACSSQRDAVVDYSVDPTVVAVVAGEPLTLDEFEAQFAKSVGGTATAEAESLASYQDFLERFVDFRLKVRLGKEAGIDTLTSIQEEIDSYRDQFARPYLIDRNVIDPIVRELHVRKTETVSASHILIRVSPQAAAADTLAAWQKLTAIRDSVLAGVDFGDLAFRNSEDPSAASSQEGPGFRGYLGWFTAGRMVQAFEDQAYGTAVGDVSEPFRTRFGYHILYVQDRRDMPEDIRLSHLMVAYEGTSLADTLKALETAQAFRDSLDTGTAFGPLARRNSTDTRSAGSDGDLGWISFDAQLVEPLKTVAFELGTGEVSQPVQSPFGVHLLTVTDVRPRPSFEDSYESLKSLASRLPRTQGAERQFATDLLTGTPHSVDTTALRNAFPGFASDSLLQALRSSSIDSLTALDTIAVLDAQFYTLGDLSDWSASQSLSPGNYPLETLLSVTNDFLLDAVLGLAVDRLEESDEEFGATMLEFRDGLVLFRIMEDSVWSAASLDSAALLALYDANPGGYSYPDRTRLLGFQSQGRAIADSVVAMLGAGLAPVEIVSSLNDSSGMVVRLDTTLISGQTNSVFDRALSLNMGEWTDPVSYNRGFIVILKGDVESARAKTFEEARAELIASHQEKLETDLIRRLRARYHAVTYPDKLVGAFGDRLPADEPTAAATE